MDPDKLNQKIETGGGFETPEETLARSREFSANLGKANTINATDLKTTPLTPPPTTTATGFAGLIESTKSSIASLTPEVKKGAEDIQATFDILGSQETKRQDELAAAGVPEKEAEYRRLTNVMQQKDLASRRRIEKIQEENLTGQLSEGQNIAIRDEERKHGSEMADLAIVAAFAKDDYELAQSVVNDRIDAETEDLNNELKSLQFFYSQNFNQLSDDRRTELLQQTAQVEREIADEEDRLREIGAIQLAAAENGAPASVITGISGSEDLTGAITAAGSWIDQTIDRDPDSTGPGAIKVVDLAPEDERILTGAGYSVQEITDLQRAVAEFGIDATLAQISDPGRKSAVQKVYNIKELEQVTRPQIEASVTQKIATTELQKLYTDDELVKFAEEAGVGVRKWWWDKKDVDQKNEWLKSDAAKQFYIDYLADQYKAAGMFGE